MMHTAYFKCMHISIQPVSFLQEQFSHGNSHDINVSTLGGPCLLWHSFSRYLRPWVEWNLVQTVQPTHSFSFLKSNQLPLFCFFMPSSVLRHISLMRRPSWRKGGPGSPQQESFVMVTEKHFIVDDECSLPMVREEFTRTTTATPTFRVKRVDCYYSLWSRSWKYRVRFLGERNVLLIRSLLDHDLKNVC